MSPLTSPYIHLLLLCALLATALADQFVYTDTNAGELVYENLLQAPLPVALLTIRTSNTYLAGTTDQILLTFKGDFSVSGPHAIGPFATGVKSEVSVTLDRVIGNLKSILLYKAGSDSYLLGELKCRIGNKLFEMTGPRQWLDALDAATEAAYPASRGFEPLAQEDDAALPAAPTLVLTVENEQFFYTTIGLAAA